MRFKFAISFTIQKVYNQTDGEPYQKPHPVRNTQLSHEVKIGQKSENGYQGELVADGEKSKNDSRKDENQDRKFSTDDLKNRGFRMQQPG